MAIERQKLQASLPRINVVNVNTGVEQTYKTIARTSERIANDFAPFAQKRAEDAGINTAKAIAKQNFIDFDNTGSPNPEHDNYNPNFGKPKAFAVPKDFGLVARSAYERVIERRFEESMQEELELKAIELSADAKNSSEYNQRFTNYLAAMDKAASGRFAEYIQNTGTAILRDSLLKLQIKEQEAAVKYAKEQSKNNIFFAQRALSKSVAMADTPESISEIFHLADALNTAIEEDFALRGDKIEFAKEKDKLAFSKAAALTNLLGSSTKGLPESERIRIKSAITNPALIKTIKDPMIRQRVKFIRQFSEGLKLDELATSFQNKSDALEAIQTEEDKEYFSSIEPELNNFIASINIAGNPLSDAFDTLIIGLNKYEDDAPEEAKGQINQLKTNAIGDAFMEAFTNLESTQNLSSTELENLKNQISIVVNMQQKTDVDNQEDYDALIDELNKLRPYTGLLATTRKLINFADEEAQKNALDKLKAFVNPKAEIEKVIEAQQKEKLDGEKAAQEAMALSTWNNFISLYNEAEESKNPEEMRRLYYEYIGQKNEDEIPLVSFLTGTELKNFEKLRAVNSKKIQKVTDKNKEAANKEALKKVTASEKEAIRLLQEKLRNPNNSLSEAASYRNQIKSIIKTATNEHSNDYLDSQSSKADSEYQQFVRKDTASQDQGKVNEVIEVVGNIRNLQESDSLTEEDAKKAIADVTTLLSGVSTGLDKKSERDYHNEIKNDYALSVIQPLMNTLREKTGGNGISPALIKQAADIANTKNTDKFNEFVKELDKDSALYLIAKGLFDASKITTARSEIRTQLGKLLEYNTTQFDQYTKEIQITNDLDAVERLGSFASDAQLRTYEDKIYTKLGGLPEGTVIDYNNGKLFRTPSGQLTALGQKIFDDLQDGTRVPNLVAALELAASAGVEDGSFLFSIFAQGMNQQPNGTNNNLWVQKGQNQLSPDTVGRFASALILYEIGGTSTPSEALREIIGADQQAGEGGVKGYLKTKLGEDLEDWIADTYPEADFQSSQILKSAAMALGRNINEGSELKKILKGFINATYGYDDKVLGTVVDPMSGFLDSGYIFGSTGKPLVVGARSKYAGTKAMKKMDAAASQLIFENISDIERQRRFEIDAMNPWEVTGVALTGVYFPPMPGFANRFFFGETEGGGAVVDEVGQMFTHDINFKYRESTQQSGVYYIMLPTRGGGGYQKLTTKEGIPVLIDIFEYQDNPKYHPNLLFYNRDFSRALSLDPNGGKFLQYKGLQPVGDEGRILNEEIVNVAPKSSTPLLRAEQALMLMRFPEMLANPTNRDIFKTLVEEKVIRKEDVDFFIPFLEQYN